MRFKKTSLNYFGQGLTEFPEEVFTTPRVYKLNLSHNKIKVIPKEIARLSYLETLELSGNQIRHLYAKLFELPKLKILILNDNNVVTLPKQIEKLQRLKILSLANNKLTELPAELTKLASLEELNVTGNHLDSLPLNGDSPFPKLKALWVGQNPLRKLTTNEVVEKLPSLRSFYCYSPKMDKPVLSNDPAIEQAARVKGNSLSSLKAFAQHPEEMSFQHIILQPQQLQQPQRHLRMVKSLSVIHMKMKII
jgi:Leucine-rich repeat (LRR) protein